MRLILSNTLCLVLISVLLFLGCSRSQSFSNNQNVAKQSPEAQTASSPITATPATDAHGKLDACSLLTTDEVKSVQGEAFKETKASGGSENGMVVSQCFFSLPTFANSVNLVVMQKGDGNGARDPKEFFEKTFTGSVESEREREREKRKEKKTENTREEEEKEGSAPQKIEGVGDEAFWTGNRVGGALYVLKHDSCIRVSVGGARDQKTKIEKSKALARLALKRLS